MKVTVVSCCRCNSPISGGHSIITLEAGNLSKTRDDPIDLCSDCCADFVEWLRGSRKFELSSSEATTTAGKEKVSGTVVDILSPSPPN
jgi:hypothetical protein